MLTWWNLIFLWYFVTWSFCAFYMLKCHDFIKIVFFINHSNIPCNYKTGQMMIKNCSNFIEHTNHSFWSWFSRSWTAGKWLGRAPRLPGRIVLLVLSSYYRALFLRHTLKIAPSIAVTENVEILGDLPSMIGDFVSNCLFPIPLPQLECL